MQIASVNSVLFSAYPIILIDKADSQENAPFFIAPSMSCDSGIISTKSSLRMFFILLFLYFFLCVWWTAGPRGCSQDQAFECRFRLLVY